MSNDASHNYMSTVDLIRELVAEDPAIAAVHVFRYSHPPQLQARITFSPAEEDLVRAALRVRESLQLPFWEAVLLSCFDHPGDHTRLLQEATFHRNHKESYLRMGRDDVLGGRIAEMSEEDSPAGPLSISSLIEVAGVGEQHWGFLDFHCAESSLNDNLVSQACSVLYKGRTHILASGKSYHSIGADYMDEVSRQRFLTQALLLAPIVDGRYVAHQLLAGASALRLSGSRDKGSGAPRLKFSIG